MKPCLNKKYWALVLCEVFRETTVQVLHYVSLKNKIIVYDFFPHMEKADFTVRQMYLLNKHILQIGHHTYTSII